MSKRVALLIVCAFIGLGLFFIGLNVLDIAEGYRFYLPIAPLNTFFIAALGIGVACLAARGFVRGVPEMLGFGGGVLAFGLGILVYGWFTASALPVRLSVYDSAFMMAALLHFSGAAFLRERAGLVNMKPGYKRIAIIITYAGIAAVIAAVTWLLYRGTLPSLVIPRDLIQGAGAVLCLAAAVVYFRAYLKSHQDFYYWYALGLVLFATGVLFMAQGALESPVGWLGRTSQYASGVYFLVAVSQGLRQR